MLSQAKDLLFVGKRLRPGLSRTQAQLKKPALSEVERALMRHRRFFFDDSAGELREYLIPDFTHWMDHDSYQRALDRLLRDLKASNTDNSAVAAP